MTLVVVVALGGTAFADDTNVTIAVRTAVAPRCAIQSQTQIVNLGELSHPGTVSLSFNFFCNSHFRLSISSQMGGLAQTAGLSASPPFVSLVPYRLNYRVGTSKGQLVDTCLSSNMIGASSSCKGASDPDAAAFDQTITLDFYWALSGQYPISGLYQDTVQLRMGPAL